MNNSIEEDENTIVCIRSQIKEAKKIEEDLTRQIQEKK